MRRALAISALTLIVIGGQASAHDTIVRWPHEGRLWHDGINYVQADYMWHRVPGGFKTSDGFLELDLQMPGPYYTGCTAWSNMPNWFSDCDTAGVSEGVAWGSDSSYVAMSAGSWFPTRILANTFYQTRYTLSAKKGNNTGTARVNFGFQEAYRYWCPDMSIWCLNGWDGGRTHTGVAWADGRVSVSPWTTAAGTTAPRDYACDVYTAGACD